MLMMLVCLHWPRQRYAHNWVACWVLTVRELECMECLRHPVSCINYSQLLLGGANGRVHKLGRIAPTYLFSLRDVRKLSDSNTLRLRIRLVFFFTRLQFSAALNDFGILWVPRFSPKYAVTVWDCSEEQFMNCVFYVCWPGRNAAVFPLTASCFPLGECSRDTCNIFIPVLWLQSPALVKYIT